MQRRDLLSSNTEGPIPTRAPTTDSCDKRSAHEAGMVVPRICRLVPRSKFTRHVTLLHNIDCSHLRSNERFEDYLSRVYEIQVSLDRDEWPEIPNALFQYCHLFAIPNSWTWTKNGTGYSTIKACDCSVHSFQSTKESWEHC